MPYITIGPISIYDSPETMTCCQCEGIEREFDARLARKELKKYRKKGLRKTSQRLVDALKNEARRAETLLDIGGGVGGIQLEMLKDGVQYATSVDASSAYLKVAREEAARQVIADRIDQRYGDFIDVADRIGEADIVTLDRVICCYHDMPTLVGTSASRARSLYGLVYPRDEWWTRMGGAAANLWMRLRRSPMRIFIHPTNEVEAVLRRHGFERHFQHCDLFWQVAVFRR